MLGAPLLVGNPSFMTAPHAPSAPSSEAPALAPRFRVHASSRTQRLARIVLPLLMGGSLLAAAWNVFFHFTGVQNPHPLGLEGGLGLLALVLFGLTRLLDGWTLAWLELEAERLVLERRRERLEIPRSAVRAFHEWRWPLPGAGLSLRMQSGRVFPYGLRGVEPGPVLEALGSQTPGEPLPRRALGVFALARALGVRRSVGSWVFKFAVFPLLPAALVFQLDQRITYGGPFAQYQLSGLGPYLHGFGLYWLYLTAALVLFASGVRALAELGALAVTCLSPPHARGVRRFVEVACAVLYYGGFIALLAARILL